MATAPDRSHLRLAPPPEPRRLRRWLFRAGRITAVAVLAVVAAGAVGVTNYQPLRGGVEGASGVVGQNVSERGRFFEPDGTEIAAFDVTAVSERSAFSFWLTVRNRGPFGVTLSHVGWDAAHDHGLPVTRVVANTRRAGAKVRPFRAMSLAPGNAIDLLATVRVARCPAPGQRLTFGEMPVTFEVLGLERHTTLPLPETITVQAGPACS